jgi:hypothetical protein
VNRGLLLQWSTVVLAVVGAALGSQFWHVELVRLLVVIAASSLLGVALALGWLTETPVPPPATVDRPASPTFVLGTPPSQPQQRPPDPPAERQWWNESKPAAAPAVAPAEAKPLSSLDASQAQIAQCPHCASFELDVHRTRRAYAFQCRNPNCRTTWEWEPGTAWPPTVVRRNLTGRTRADS